LRKPIIIFGAGGLGREIKTIVDALPEWEVIGFCDDKRGVGTMVMNAPVLGNTDYLLQIQTEQHVVIGIGNPRTKSKVIEALHANPFLKFPTLIHPGAVLGDKLSIQIGAGTVITAGCILTTSIAMGNHVLLNLNTTVGHDVRIGDCTSIMPGVNIAGNVTIGEQVMIGSGANVINDVVIEDEAIVGAGSVVIRNVGKAVTVVGVPAKTIRYGE